MRDPDSLVPGDALSVLAHELNDAMHASTEARKRYAEIYGQEWQPLGTVDGSAYYVPGCNPFAIPVYDDHTEQETYPFDTVNLRPNH